MTALAYVANDLVWGFVMCVAFALIMWAAEYAKTHHGKGK